MSQVGVKSDKTKHYNWFVTPDAYLATALLLCKNIPRSFPEENRIWSSICRDLGFRSGHPDYELVYPIVFNLKHAIELYLKGLGCISNAEYLQKHDLSEIFNFIIASASTNNKVVLEELKKDIWPVIKKYYFGTYIPTITIENKPDLMNDAERYPESQKAYDPKDPFLWFTNGVLNQIEKDIIFLEKKFAQAKRDIFDSNNP